MPSTQLLLTEDLNRSAEEFEFAFTGVSTPVTLLEPIRLGNAQSNDFAYYPQFQYDQTYSVRIRARQGTVWSEPGPPCTFTLRNNAKFAGCAAVISSTQKVVTTDNNSGAARYLFEIATDPGFQNLLAPSIDVGKYQWTAFTQHPQVKYETPYYLRIRAKNNEKHTAWSDFSPNTCAFSLKNTFRFTYCPTPMPLSQRIVVGNNSPADAGAFLFEFAKDDQFQPLIAEIPIAPYEWNSLNQYPQFRYDTSYAVRVRVKQSASDEKWSNAGPVCTFRTEPCPAALKVEARSGTSPCSSSGGATATVSGGTPPYLYLWSPGGATSSALTAVSAGPYSVSVEDARGCKGTANVSIGSMQALSVCITTQDVSCLQENDGVAISTTTGGMPPYSYQWSTTPPQMTASAAGVPVGLWVVTVTDAAGCSRKATAAVTKATCPPGK